MTIELTCENCAQPFYCYPSEAEKGRKYCSLECRSKHRFAKELPVASRTPVNFICKECEEPFTMMQSYLTAYKKKFDRDPMYCSMACSNAGRRKDTEARNRFTCVNCGKERTRHRNNSGRVYIEQKVCGKQCKNEWVSKLHRERHGLPTITRRIKRNYAILRIPARDGKPAFEILEHRYVMQQHIGRELLPEETVHHISGNRLDNSLENLELFSSNHGPGQRVIDKLQFAVELFTLYPEIGRSIGYELRKINHPTDAPTETQPALALSFGS